MSEAIKVEDAVQLLRTVAQHRDYVRVAIQRVTQELERRALAHDLSKLNEDEFAGFSRINRAAREHPYGSEQYRAGLRQEKPTIDLHYSRNSHHPEFHRDQGGKPDPTDPSVNIGGLCVAGSMGFLDIIEMVCDWRGAYLGYGSQGSWQENMERQRKRYEGWFTVGQWWLINQVAGILEAS